MKNVDLQWIRSPHSDLSIEMVGKEEQRRSYLKFVEK